MYNTKGEIEDIHSDITNTNHLSHFLYSTLYFTVIYHVSNYIWFFLFHFKSELFYNERKNACDKLWLTEYKVEHKKYDRLFVFEYNNGIGTQKYPLLF